MLRDNKETKTLEINKKSLKVITSFENLQLTSKEHKAITLSKNTAAALQKIQSEKFLKKFNTDLPLEGKKMIQGISHFFQQYAVPIGLLSKLLKLSEYYLDFIIDDSTSMNIRSGMRLSEATSYIQARYPKKLDDCWISRWEEAENIVHIMVDLLSYVPINPIQIRFFNRKEVFILNPNAPAAFRARAHEAVKRAFDVQPHGQGLSYDVFKHAFENELPILHYIYTDGDINPEDVSIEALFKFIKERNRNVEHSIHFIQTSKCDDELEDEFDEDELYDAPLQHTETLWEKVRNEKFISVIRDYASESKRVSNVQGPAFPFTHGIWLLRQLCAAINPDDLGQLDKQAISKNTLDTLLGRVHSEEEYIQNKVSHSYEKLLKSGSNFFSLTDDKQLPQMSFSNRPF